MKINTTAAEVMCSNPFSMHNYFAWPSVTKLQDGRLAMVASGFRWRHICPFGKVVICFSDDEGKRWSAPSVIIDTDLDDRDAGIVQMPSGEIVVSTFNNTTDFQRKWNPEQKYINGYLDLVESRPGHNKFLGSVLAVSYDNAKSFKKLFNVPITCPHGPTVLNDGTLLYVGTVFDETGMAPDEPSLRAYRISLDGSYEHIGSIENVDGMKDFGARAFCCEPHTVELKSGKLITHIRVECRDGTPGFTIYQSESEDGGRTWTKPHPILDKTAGAPAHLIEHSSGMLISTYGCRRVPTLGVKVMFSRDGGESWDTDHILYHNDQNADLGYPCSTELSDGKLLTVYYGHPEKNTPAVIMQSIWSFEE